MATDDEMMAIDDAETNQDCIFNFDIDGNGIISPDSDGLMLVRYMFEYRGEDLITGLIADGATRETSEEITEYLDQLNEFGLLDADGDGRVNALTDGVLAVRAQQGRTGDELTRRAIGPEATLTTSEIEEFLGQVNSLEGVVIIEEFGFDLTTATDLGAISESASISGATDFFEEASDIYKFTIDEGSDITITLSGLDANGDAELLLIEDINGNGMVSGEEEFEQEIIESEGGSGGDATITAILLPREYFVVVEPFAGQANYDLSISATTVTIPDDGAGNNGETARDIGTLSTQEQVFNDFVGDADERDIYRFNLDAESEVSINVSNLSADADWFIIQDLNGDGREQEEEFIDGSFNEGNADEAGTLRLASGEYFLIVEQFTGNTDYNLAISAAAAPEIPTLSDAIDLATLNNTANDSVSDDNPIDLYSFTLNNPSEVTLTLEGLTADADLFLLQDINGNGQIDADGVAEGEGELVDLSDEPETTSETISDFLEAGTYYVTVEQFQGNTDYSLNLATAEFFIVGDDNNTIAQGGDLGPVRDDMGGLKPMTFSGSVGDDDPIDYYTFTIFEPPNLPNMEDPRVDLEVRLEVRGGNADLRVILDENDDGEVSEEEVLDISATNGNDPDRIFIPDLEAGTYVIEVEQFSGEVQYDLTITPEQSRNPRDTRPDDLGEIFGTEGIILTEEPVMFEDSVNNRDGMDWFVFTILEDGELDITLTGLSADADLSLIADVNGNGEIDAGERILISANNSNNDESIQTGALPAGDYFVSVDRFAGETEYRLAASVTPSSVPGMIPPPPAGRSMATPIAQSSANFAASGGVSPGNPFVFYRFTVDRSGIFTANLTGLTENADLRLIRDFNDNKMIDPVVDRNGNQYIDNGEVEIRAFLPNSGTESEQIRAFLEPGEYFLQVTNSVEKQTTNYNVETRFQAAQSDPQAFDIEVTLSEAAQMVLTDPLEEAVVKAADFWEQVITHSTFSGKHTVSIAVDVDELGAGVLASAGPTTLRRDENGNTMTVRGEATINRNPTIQALYDRDLQFFYDTMIHEFAHVLGFFGGSNQTTALRTSDDSDGFSQRVVSLPSLSDRNLVTTEDESNPVYNADTFAGIAYGELLGTFMATELQLTRGVGEGSDLSHWWEDIFGNEMMTESGSPGINELLDEITIGAMRDLGYHVNYGAAERYTLEL
ncbi:MAG: pre-peptidase C-terminal domain-containing protein [Hormoscilla sp.]